LERLLQLLQRLLREGFGFGRRAPGGADLGYFGVDRAGLDGYEVAPGQFNGSDDLRGRFAIRGPAGASVGGEGVPGVVSAGMFPDFGRVLNALMKELLLASEQLCVALFRRESGCRWRRGDLALWLNVCFEIYVPVGAFGPKPGEKVLVAHDREASAAGLRV
jgi:hypothetical protein